MERGLVRSTVLEINLLVLSSLEELDQNVEYYCSSRLQLFTLISLFKSVYVFLCEINCFPIPHPFSPQTKCCSPLSLGSSISNLHSFVRTRRDQARPSQAKPGQARPSQATSTNSTHPYPCHILSNSTPCNCKHAYLTPSLTTE